jgi:phospholipid-binding lipoprotein MlaA
MPAFSAPADPSQSALDSNFPAGFDDSFEDEFAVVETRDPLSAYNRWMTGINDYVYTSLLFPVARRYERAIPEPGRQAILRFYNNLRFPVRIVNNLLQLKISNSADELTRFTVNSTLGIGGLFDPASTWLGISPHEEDFGQTLGHYGVGGGFHVVLPFWGPSNVRDAITLVPNWYFMPDTYFERRAINLLDNRSEALLSHSIRILNESSLTYPEYENLKRDAFDLYPFYRNVYEQSRAQDISE